MSVTIRWRPLLDEGGSFNSGTSTSLERLKKAFGSVIEKEDAEKLRAMAIAADDTFYDEVADVVEQVGAIDFWGEH